MFIHNVLEEHGATPAKREYWKVIANYKKKSAIQTSRETCISRSNVYRILRRRKWKSYMPTMVHMLLIKVIRT